MSSRDHADSWEPSRHWREIMILFETKLRVPGRFVSALLFDPDYSVPDIALFDSLPLAPLLSCVSWIGINRFCQPVVEPF